LSEKGAMGSIDREKRIEDLVCTFPSLFGLENGFQTLRQYRYSDAGQPDVVFRWPDRSLVVEIKKGPLVISHLNQLTGYLHAEADERGIDAVKGLLLGGIPARPHLLVRAAKAFRFAVDIRFLEADFMLEVKFCRSCSAPFWARFDRCPYCCSREHVLVEF